MRKVTRKTSTLVRQAICKELKGLTVHTLKATTGPSSPNTGKSPKPSRPISISANGLIRQFFPKHSKFATITDEQIKHVQDKLNNRPRKSLNYKTPNEVYFNTKEHLIPVVLAS